MTRFTIAFSGRLLGAIGVHARYIVDVEAETFAAAVLKLYDTHEHIHCPRVVHAVDLDGAEGAKP